MKLTQENFDQIKAEMKTFNAETIGVQHPGKIEFDIAISPQDDSLMIIIDEENFYFYPGDELELDLNKKGIAENNYDDAKDLTNILIEVLEVIKDVTA